jgi:hypothetical protein
VYYLFIYLFALACFRSLSLDTNDFGNLQELDFQDIEQQPAGEQGNWPLTTLFQYPFALQCTQAACINWLPKPSYFRIGFLWLVALLSPTVMSVVQVFPSIWYWVWLVLSVESVGLPSVVMWCDCGEIWCCGLSKVWNGGDGLNSLGDVVCHARIC